MSISFIPKELPPEHSAHGARNPNHQLAAAQSSINLFSARGTYLAYLAGQWPTPGSASAVPRKKCY